MMRFCGSRMNGHEIDGLLDAAEDCGGNGAHARVQFAAADRIASGPQCR
jgi:hypothetical protein